ncbi:MAG: NADH-quinone oxidoreductase subunit H [Planctomycetes bacterium]|nr:NADH-quinone oxidoreductase subunit H [Planctomycetota bacterium]
MIGFAATILKALFVIGMALQIVPGCIYFERKIAAYVQHRIGPNRVNFTIGTLRYLMPESMRDVIPEGLARVKLIPGSLQPLADAIKLAFKEEVIPEKADKLLYNLGPMLTFIPVGTALCFLPFGATLIVPDANLFGIEIQRTVIEMSVSNVVPGMLMLLAVSSLGVYGIACGGWGSGSKYPLMAAVRAAAQMVSYEVPLGIAFLIALASVGSLDGQEIVRNQAETWHGFGWLVFRQPLAALIFLVAMFAENNRLPFDLPEAEPELVGGYHTEYTGLKFAIFFLGEYCAMILMCGLFTTLFLGGWSLGPIEPVEVFGSTIEPLITAEGGILNVLLSVAVFTVKMLSVLLLQLWIRWTLPRFRYDQLMDLGWKVLTPLALANLAITAILISKFPNFTFFA